MKPKKGSIEAIGARIRKLRVKRSLTQTQAGEALGVTWQQFAKYEKGANRITADALAKLAKRFKCDTAYFFR